MSIAEIYKQKSQEIKYPISDPKTLSDIEDMAGLKRREKAKEKYRKELREAKNKYSEEHSKLQIEFKLALFEEYNVSDNPKREKAFSIAWEKGHSNGLNEVESEFSDLVELIK